MTKFKQKKVCRICTYPIVFHKDAYYKPGTKRDSSGELIKYPLNIHYVDCANQAYMNGLDLWEVSRRPLSKLTQMRLAFR